MLYGWKPTKFTWLNSLKMMKLVAQIQIGAEKIWVINEM